MESNRKRRIAYGVILGLLLGNCYDNYVNSKKLTNVGTFIEDTILTSDEINFTPKYDLLTSDEYNFFSDMKKMKSLNNDELTKKIIDNNSVEKIGQICGVIKKTCYDNKDKTEVYNTQKIIDDCISERLFQNIMVGIRNSNLDNIKKLTEEEKKEYNEMYELYNNYLNYKKDKDAYKMIDCALKIYDKAGKIDSFIVKNKIQNQIDSTEHLNFKGYNPNLKIGDSILSELIEKETSSKNKTEISMFAIRSYFQLFDEKFMVEKFDDEYVAFKINNINIYVKNDLMIESNEQSYTYKIK